MEKYIIAKRGVRSDWGDWSNPQEVLTALQRYDLGEVEIMQAKKGLDWFLYCVPRKEKHRNRRPYFCDDNYCGILLDRCINNGVKVII